VTAVGTDVLAIQGRGEAYTACARHGVNYALSRSRPDSSLWSSIRYIGKMSSQLDDRSWHARLRQYFCVGRLITVP